jgi:prepilin-type N-terminal cleavage/methylation domain-containing protein
MSKTRGFTLIELLIVVSIISILASIGLVVYTSVLKQGRDSKRQSDLRSIQSALEQYYADQLYYPSAPLPGADSPLKSPDNTKTYINRMPSDPTPSRSYYYAVVGTSYCLYAYLENLSSSNLNGCASYGSYNFAITPP